MYPEKSPRQIGLFALVMMAIISVDSLRNVPIAAQYGLSLVTFYTIAGLLFFLPLAWVTSTLATTYPKTGGSYVWIKEAFGFRMGNIAIGLQWIYNMVWYPTIFVFITTTLFQVIAPHWEQNKWFVLVTSLGFFWLLSAMHCCGMRMSSWISIASALIGTLVPMFLIIGFAVYWLMSGHASATPLHWDGLLPTSGHIKNMAYFSNILFSILGLDVIAMQAGFVKNPRTTFPIALGLSSVLILLTLVGSALALCVIMPPENITLINGLMDTLHVFFSAYGYQQSYIGIGICIIIGGLGIAASWMISLARGLHVSLSMMNAPKWLLRVNKNEVPSRVIVMQAIIYTLLLIPFLFSENINRSYWLLSALTAQCALVYYVILFCAALILIKRTQKGLKLWQGLLGVLACSLCVFGIITACITPNL